MSGFFTGYLLPAALAGSLACGLALALRPLWRRVGSRPQRLLLMAAVLLMLLPLGAAGQSAARALAPAGEAGGSLKSLPGASLAYTAGQSLGTALEPEAAPPKAEHTPLLPAGAGSKASPTLPGALEALALLYLAGAALAAGRLLWQRRRLHLALRHAAPVQNAELAAMYAACCEEKAVRRAPALLWGTAQGAPFLAGVLHPAIVLPEGSRADEATRYALLHELTHLRHGDLPCKLLAALAAVLHWYNPLAHWLKRELAACCEHHCDAAMTEGLSSTGRMQYAKALLLYAGAPLPQGAAGFSLPARRMQQRLRMLLRPAPGKPARRAGFALASLTVLAAALAGCSMAAGSSEATASQTAGPASSAPASQAAESSAASQQPASDASNTAASQSTEASSETPAATPSAPAGESTAASEPVLHEEAPASLGEDIKLTVWPQEDTQYISRWGGPEENHRGVDLNAAPGAEIYAMASGTVQTAEEHWSYGNYVVVEHEGGYTTLYAHCNELKVQAGETVAAGDVIATTGETGNTAGSLLHLEIQRTGGTLLAPRGYIEELIPEGIPH